MVAGYHVNQATWLSASGPSQVELVVIDWIRHWLGYPESAGGLFTSGGSAASLNALMAAREAAGSPERATVYLSDQSHSAHIRAARIIGVRPECIRMLPSDERFRMDIEALVRAVAEDRAGGFHPIAECADAGSSSTGAIDPLEAMAEYCEEEGLWLHVDAAYGGFAAVTEKGRTLLRGIERIARRSRRKRTGGAQQGGARSCLLGRPRVHVIDASPRHPDAAAVHRESRHRDERGGPGPLRGVRRQAGPRLGPHEPLHRVPCPMLSAARRLPALSEARRGSHG